MLLLSLLSSFLMVLKHSSKQEYSYCTITVSFVENVLEALLHVAVVSNLRLGEHFHARRSFNCQKYQEAC